MPYSLLGPPGTHRRSFSESEGPSPFPFLRPPHPKERTILANPFWRRTHTEREAGSTDNEAFILQGDGRLSRYFRRLPIRRPVRPAPRSSLSTQAGLLRVWRAGPEVRAPPELPTPTLRIHQCLVHPSPVMSKERLCGSRLSDEPFVLLPSLNELFDFQDGGSPDAVDDLTRTSQAENPWAPRAGLPRCGPGPQTWRGGHAWTSTQGPVHAPPSLRVTGEGRNVRGNRGRGRGAKPPLKSCACRGTDARYPLTHLEPFGGLVPE